MVSFKTVNGKEACTTRLKLLLLLCNGSGFKTVNGKEACTTRGRKEVHIDGLRSRFKTVNGKEACTTAGVKSGVVTLRKSVFWK